MVTPAPLGLVGKVLAVAASLDSSGLPWAFGGALALAYATREPRGTRDLDVNVFVPSSQLDDVVSALPEHVQVEPRDLDRLRRDDQVRLWWEDTPIDLFLSVGAFHDAVATRVRRVDFAGSTIAVLAPDDLAVFKVLFDRPKDWVDIATMVESNSVDVDIVISRVTDLLGDDPRLERLERLEHLMP